MDAQPKKTKNDEFEWWAVGGVTQAQPSGSPSGEQGALQESRAPQRAPLERGVLSGRLNSSAHVHPSVTYWCFGEVEQWLHEMSSVRV